MKKKILTLSLVVALAATAIIGGTLAYFTDVTEEKENVFTVGGVEIELNETEWDENEDHNILPGVTFDKNPTITVDEDSDNAYVFLEMDLNKYVSLVNLMGVDAYINNIGGLTGEYPGFIGFVQNILDDATLRAAVIDRWFVGIEHEKWEIMNEDELKDTLGEIANKNNPKHLTIVFGYKGDNDETPDVVEAKDSFTFMTAFGMPKTVTQSMMNGDDAYKVNDVSKSNFNTESSDFKITFTAHAIQDAEIDGLTAAYEELFGNN